MLTQVEVQVQNRSEDRPMVRPPVAKGVPVDYDPFAGGELAAVVASTESQREIWTAATMEPAASRAFNESISLELVGALDVPALEAALAQVARRFDALRSTLSPDGLLLVVARDFSGHLALSDWSDLPAGRQAEEIQRLKIRHVNEPFDLTRGPLFRFELVRLGAERHLLVISAHHIVCDGWSMAVLVQDLGRFYGTQRRHLPAELAPVMTFVDYARQERMPPETVAYWLTRLGEEPPVLDLPYDRPRPASRTWQAARLDRTLPEELVRDLKRASAKAKVSLFTTLLATFQVLLHRLSGQSRVVTGIPAAGQAPFGDQALVGHCVNLLPYLGEIDGGQTLGAFVAQSRGTLLDAFEHQQCTLGGLLRQLKIARDPARLPLVSVLFNVDQGMSGQWLAFDGLTVRYSSNPRTAESFELFVNATEASGRFVLECQYNTDLVSEAVVSQWLAAYEALLAAFVAAPETRIERLPLLAGETRSLVLETWNDIKDAAHGADTARHARPGQTVDDLIAAQAALTPDRLAVTLADGRGLTYRDLLAKADLLAGRLAGLGVEAGDRVGLCMERSPSMVVALVAILRAGATYLPLDPAFPRERLRYMIEDAGVAVIVTDERAATALPSGAARLCLADESVGAGGEGPGGRGSVRRRGAEPAPAYIIYTSGSTGQPKGVVVGQRAVVNFLESMARRPGLAAEDRLLAVTTISFDIHVLEIFLPLVVGGRVVLASRDEAMDGPRLARLIEEQGITVMQATPSTWRLLLESGWQGGPGFKALSGGEALPRELAGRLLAGGLSLWNMYGPTETTVWSTCHEILGAAEPPRIGRPIANTQAYVLDALLAPVPAGVVGELYLGGDGVADGYWQRPELTRERFIPSPFDPAKTLYRTGDLARWHGDGTLECLGRADFQVKLRGFRIELGEIETVLAGHPAVAACAVDVRELGPDDSRLVAWWVGRSEVAEAELRAHLAGRLPSYMIPQLFQKVAALPLTPNGKLDRRRLVVTSDSLAAVEQPVALVEASATPTEALVAAIWKDVLKVATLDRQANFFESGGHSLLAAQALSRLLKEHGIALPLRTMFEAPTVAKLAALIDQGRERAVAVERPAAAARIAPKRGDGCAPLTYMQQRLWYLEQLTPGRSVFNLPSAFRVTGPLAPELFAAAFEEVTRRHEALRTTFRDVEGQGVQVIHTAVALDLSPVDLSLLPPRERETCLRQELDLLADEPFDLQDGPLFRARLYKMGEQDWVFSFVVHHAIWDGWSFDVFLEELSSLYEAYTKGLPSPLAPPPIQYADFAIHQRQAVTEQALAPQLAYWRQQLRDLPQALELPTDRPRPPVMSHKGASEFFQVPRDVVEALTEVGRRVGATFQMTLLAAFKVLLHRYARQDDIVVGGPIRGRSLPETERLLGFFVNTLVLRTDLSGAPPFLELLARVKRTCLDAYTHDEVPLELLVGSLKIARDPSRSPLFQTIFTFQDVRNRETRFGDCPYAQVNVHPKACQTDLSFWAKQSQAGLVAGFDYASDLFDAGTIRHMIESLVALLRGIAADPTRTIDRLPLVSSAQRQLLLGPWSGHQQDFPAGETLKDLIEARARAQGSKTAIIYEGTRLTFAEVNGRANQLARHLRRLGVGRGRRVGLCLERTGEMVVAMVAILKAGGAYVPLDPGYPKERLAFMVEDGGLALIVTHEGLAGRFGWSGALCLDRTDLSAWPTVDLEPSSADPTPDDTAYVIYTSGSTGKPKGSLVPHRTVVNLLHGLETVPGIAADDTILAVATISFDMAVPDLFMPLTVGATMVLAPREATLNASRVVALLEEHDVTVMQGTPSTYRLLVDAGWKGSPRLKAILGGEPLSREQALKLSTMTREVWNGYGPTETTVYTTFHQVTDFERPMYIGRPVANARVYIVDRHGELAPIGVPGEIVIGGAGVSDGYLARPELTREKFIPDPFAAEAAAAAPGPSPARLYRSGDIGRFSHDGLIECLGRNDNQVKVRGFRIELGEIEDAMLRHPEVKDAVVMVRQEGAGDSRIVGYYIAKGTLSPQDLRASLKQTLPEHMVPQHCVALAAFPLSPNGKVDKNRLPAPQSVRSEEAHFIAPRTEAERVLAQIWAELLGVERVSVDANFFDIGGHSLLSIQMLARVKERTGVKLSPLAVVVNTLAQIAANLGPSAIGGAPPAQVPSPAPGLWRRLWSSWQERR